jgi:ribosome-binding factor A
MGKLRTERLAAVIQRDVGQILQKSYQPSGSFITITEVEVTEDLFIAKLYISIYAPGKDAEAIYQHLVQQNVAIRKELASKIRHQVRRIPELHFNKDLSAQRAEKMEKLFTEIKEERESRGDEEE